MGDGRQRPLFIGLTGSIASGKSTVLAELEKLGVPVISTDAIVHEIYEDPEVIEIVRERFGDDVINEGAVDRDAVAAEVFAEPEARVWLEQLIWPRVGTRIFQFRARHDESADPPPAIVVEVPLLFESGMDQAFDRTVTVTASQQVRFSRAESRGTGVSELEAREARHMSAEEKAERADWQIDNSGSVDALDEQLRAMLAEWTKSST
ncbi:MAG: dephospho-CoA kinase [Actinobacteria bacterium]|nr:dephospho-CoA kinase [Actinomycetota bacterium]